MNPWYSANDNNDDHVPCSAHWADLRTLFYDALPPGTVHYDHEMVAFEQDEAGVLVTARTRGLCGGTQEFQFRGDILVDASGCNSTIRKAFIPDEKRRWVTGAKLDLDPGNLGGLDLT